MKLKAEKVYSPLKDDNIKNDLMNSPIWKRCEHPDNIDDIDLTGWFEYTIKFDGVTPVQVSKVKKCK